MLLEHPALEPFEPTLRRVAETAFAGGLDAVAKTRRRVQDIDHDQVAHRRFIRGCHYGSTRPNSMSLGSSSTSN